jgi:Reverse transcriptase (RNA-dependent DNA polymerase)
MPVKFENFAFSFRNERDKPVFVPNEKGYEVGYRLKALVEQATTFEPFYFHFRNGGHVAALHEHRKNRCFARVDLKTFFYSISRNRVARALHEIKIPKAGHYAKCSCVKNPYGEPSYSLPYGFVQSPILATLVFSRSVLGEFLRECRRDITLSVYMDDIAISSPSYDVLQKVFEELTIKIQEANFPINLEKTMPPTKLMNLFNCEIELNRTSVMEARRAAFYAGMPSATACEAFERYCQSIECGNEWPQVA